jgi:hypothetical protein
MPASDISACFFTTSAAAGFGAFEPERHGVERDGTMSGPGFFNSLLFSLHLREIGSGFADREV